MSSCAGTEAPGRPLPRAATATHSTRQRLSHPLRLMPAPENDSSAGMADAGPSTAASAASAPAPVSSAPSTPMFAARACRNCAVAKTKCVTLSGGNGDCERCHRLKRVCVRDQPSHRKRKPPTAKSLRLEQKLDRLVTLLSKTPQQQSDHQRSSSSSATPDVLQHTPSATHTTSPEVPEPPRPRNRPPSPVIHGEKGSFSARPVIVPCDQSELEPSDEEAGRCLHHYQTYMSKYFPFVVIPPGTTVASLRSNNPFLLKAIVVVSSIQDLVRQRGLGHALMNHFVTRLLVQGERNVDMLQGILLWSAWYHVHFFTNPQMTNLLQLAVGLVIDLGLKRTVRAYGAERLETAITRSAHGELAISELHTSDERRALLGTFYLTSIVSQWAKRYDSLRFSAQFEEACRNLEEAREYPSDRYLVYLVRLQRIVQRIERKVPIDDFNLDTMIPIAMFVKALHSELDEFKKSLPADLAEHTFMRMHYHSAEIYLYEISLSSLPPTPQYGDYTYRRLEMLNACMQTAKEFVGHYHEIPPSSYINLPFIHFSQLTSTIIALSKLTRLECPGWDRTYAQAFIDFNGIMEQTASRYEGARNVAEVPVHDNPLFTFFARKLRFIKAWNEAKLKGIEYCPRGSAPTNNPGGEPTANAAEAQQSTTAAERPSGGTDTPAPALSGLAAAATYGDPEQLMDICQDDLFEQLDVSFWQEWATGDLSMWGAEVQTSGWGGDNMTDGFSG